MNPDRARLFDDRPEAPINPARAVLLPDSREQPMRSPRDESRDRAGPRPQSPKRGDRFGADNTPSTTPDAGRDGRHGRGLSHDYHGPGRDPFGSDSQPRPREWGIRDCRTQTSSLSPPNVDSPGSQPRIDHRDPTRLAPHSVYRYRHPLRSSGPRADGQRAWPPAADRLPVLPRQIADPYRLEDDGAQRGSSDQSPSSATASPNAGVHPSRAQSDTP